MTRDFRWIGLSLLFALVVTTGQARAELLLFYEFNDASDAELAKDSSGKGNDGTLLGDVDEIPVYTADGTGHTGKPGDRAVDFGFYTTNGGNIGSGAYIEVESAIDGAFASIVDNDTFTISTWIRGSEEQPQPQWNFYAGPGRQFGSHIPWSDETIYFDVAGCCTPTQRINISEPDASKWNDEGWNHYVFVKDESYTAIYQNGEFLHDSGEDLKDPLSEISELYIGAGPASDRRSYSGLIDDFAIWDNVLSEEDIKKVFDGTFFGGGGVTGDFNANGTLEAADIDLLSAEVRAGTNQGSFDLNADNKVDSADRTVWVATLKKTWFGDADLNGEFNSSDFVAVFTTGKYETNQAAGWAEGDWDGDARFSSSDFVSAFQDGGYEKGPRPGVAGVPEPTGIAGLALGLVLVRSRIRRRR
jgi:hypothetical protein